MQPQFGGIYSLFYLNWLKISDFLSKFAIKVKDDIDAISSVIARGDVMHPLFSYEEAYAP